MKAKVTDNLAVKKYAPHDFEEGVLYRHQYSSSILILVKPKDAIKEEDFKARHGFVAIDEKRIGFIPYNDVFKSKDWVVLGTEVMLSNEDEDLQNG